ncbi:hypothetical protein ACMFMG_001864 [Clarireedia jacksonii]
MFAKLSVLLFPHRFASCVGHFRRYNSTEPPLFSSLTNSCTQLLDPADELRSISSLSTRVPSACSSSLTLHAAASRSMSSSLVGNGSKTSEGRHWPQDPWRGGFGAQVNHWERDPWRGGFGPSIGWDVNPGCGM